MRYLEQGIKHVVNWILGPGEEMLNGKQQVGYDIVSAEEYKRNHEVFELQCRVRVERLILFQKLNINIILYSIYIYRIVFNRIPMVITPNYCIKSIVSLR